MQFRVLGPLEVLSNSAAIAINRALERRLLAILLANADSPVSTDRLIDSLWADDLPANPDAALQTAVSRLRRALEQSGEPHGIRTGSGHYVLELGDNTLDARRFEEMANGAIGLEPAAAAAQLNSALALWRGRPYADFEYEEFPQGEVRRLLEVRRVAFESRIAAELDLGHHEAILAVLRAELAKDPLDEKLWGHLMLALYRSGRQAEALRTYQQARSTLLEQLGIDPSPALRRLEEAILMQDASLELTGDSPVSELPDVMPSLPVPIGELIGRDAEVARISERLDSHRLVSIVGPPGVGKSRLALEVAAKEDQSYPDGSVWANVDAAGDTTGFEQAIVDGLGLGAGAEGARMRLLDWARGREQLLIVDGCEAKMPEAVPVVADLLAECRGMTILVTSRERLGIRSESVEWLHPLRVSDDTEGPDEQDAVTMFVKRAANHTAAFAITEANLASIRRIVAGVDGLPLGIELAAGRLVESSLEEIADDLDADIGALSGSDRDAPEGHQSLESAIEASWRRLPDDVARVLAGLALFRGTWTIDDAVSLLEPEFGKAEVSDLVLDLVNRSLLAPRVRTGAQSRAAFTMLDVIRRFALSKLDDWELRGEMRRRHARATALAIAAAAEGVRSRGMHSAHAPADRLLDSDVALDWMVETGSDDAISFARDLADIHLISLRLPAAEELIEGILEHADPQGLDRAALLVRLAFTRNPGSGIGAENVVFRHPFGNLMNRERIRSDARQRLALGVGEYRAAIEIYAAANQDVAAGTAEMWLAWLLAAQGELDEAEQLVRAAIPVVEGVPNAERPAHLLLANLAIASGDDFAALEELRAAERADVVQQPQSRVFQEDIAARISRANGRPAEAFNHYRRALVEYAEPHNMPGAAVLHAELGFLATQLRDYETALTEFGEALVLGRLYGLPRIPGTVRLGQGMLEVMRGDYGSAVPYFRAGGVEFERLGDREGLAQTYAARAKAEIMRAEYDTGLAYALRGIPMIPHGPDMPVASARLLESVAVVAASYDEFALAARLLGAADGARAPVRTQRSKRNPANQLPEVLRVALGGRFELELAQGGEQGLDRALDLAVEFGSMR